MSQSSPTSEISSAAQLLEAVDKGDTARVNSLLTCPEIVVNACNKHGESALHIAAGNGRVDIVQSLCANGAAVNIRDKRGDTPLYWAARHGHLEAVKYLCTKKADVNVQDMARETALHVSARYDQPEVLSYLCEAGAQLNLPDNEGDTPLHCGVWNGYQGVVECLVGAGSSLHCRNKDGETPLHVAAVRGCFSLVQFLCENEAGINVQDKAGCTAVHLATKRSHTDIVRYLCSSANCNVNIQNKNGDTALHDACREGNLFNFLVLLRSGTVVNLQNRNKATPLHLAAKYGHLELVRHLCVSGSNINGVIDNGFTADQVAANASHQEIAALIHHLRMGDLHQHCVSELTSPGNSSPRKWWPQKLLVCGASGVGKTELVNSLKCSYLRSMFRRRSGATLAHMIRQRTYGIAVQHASIPGAGEFSIWDFSGMKSYYPLHEEFLGSEAAIFLLVFSLRDPLERQLTQLRFWLAMITAKLPQENRIQYAGERQTKPSVVLVASFADLRSNLTTTDLIADPDDAFSAPLVSTIFQARLVVSNQENVLAALRHEFGDVFHFSDVVFSLDCRLSQSPEMRGLRSHLGALKEVVMQQTELVTLPIIQTFSRVLGMWRTDHASFPILTWPNFVNKTRKLVNPLVTEDLMTSIALTLHILGEVVYIKEGLLANIVILDPAWLGRDIFGPALSPENSVIPQLKSVTGHISLSLLRRVYPEWDANSIAHLFEHFELCLSVDEQRSTFLFPGLIEMEPLYGLWEKDLEFTVYSGIHICCQRDLDVFSPSLFPKIQIQARRTFSDDIEDQELTLWSGGLKCCRGGVEILMSYPKVHKTIEIIVRGTEETRLDCYSLLQQFYAIVTGAIRRINPGTSFQTRLLSPKRLKTHQHPVLSYSPDLIFAAERGNGALLHSDLFGEKEDILDVACCGCEELLPGTKSAPYSHFHFLSMQTRTELSRMLDPPHPLGQDWCLLALQLSFTEEVPRIHQANNCSSPTDQLLKAWEQNSQSTVVSIIDALRAIGRSDAASVLIRGLSPFSNTSNTVVINLPGAVVTSYLC